MITRRLTPTTLAAFIILWGAAVAGAQRPELVVQTGHTSAITSVAFSADGKTLASASGDNTIKLWEVSTGTELRTLGGPFSGLRSVAFSPDGKLVLSLAADGIALWNVITGEKVSALADSGGIKSFAVSPDCKVIAGVGQFGRSVSLWDVASGRRLRQLASHGGWVMSAAFSPDGRTLASAGQDKTVKLWDWASGRELHTLAGADDELLSVAFRPDGKVVAAGSQGGRITLWDLRTRARTGTITVKGKYVDELLFSPDGATLMVTVGMASIFYDLQTGGAYDLEADGLKRGKKGEAFAFLGAVGGYSARLSPDWQRMAAPGLMNTIRVFDDLTEPKTRFIGRMLAGLGEPVLSPDKKLLAVGTPRGIRLWPLTGGHEPLTLDDGEGNTPDPTVTGWPHTIVFSRDSKTVFDGRKLWSVASGKQLSSAARSPRDHYSLVFSGDGRRKVIWGGEGGVISILDAESGAGISHIQADSISCVALSYDGSRLAAATPGQVTLWDAATGRALRKYEVVVQKFVRAEGVSEGRAWREYGMLRHDVVALAFSGDGSRLAGAGVLSARIWDVASGRVLQTLTDDAWQRSFRTVAFSHDGRTLASFGGPENLRLWDIERGQQLKLPNPLPEWVKFDGVALLTTKARSLLITTTGVGLSVRDVVTNEELAQIISLDEHWAHGDEHQWLVTTGDGFFDGPPAAWGKARWRFANDTFNVVPVEAFFKEFFYPGLLQDIIRGVRPLPPARDFATMDVRQPAVRITHVNGQPVLERDGKREVELSPAEKPQHTAEVAVEVTDNDSPGSRATSARTSGARDLRLFRNGTLVRVWRGDLFDEQSGCSPVQGAPHTPRRAVCKATVQLSWDNQLTAYAFNREDVKSNDATASLRGGAGLVGDFYVLAVGINRYENEDFNLRFAVPDALAIGAELARQQQALFNYAQRKVVTLTDAEATKPNILYALSLLAGDGSSEPPAALSSELRQELSGLTRLKPGDALVVYFAGHGTARADRFYLLPHDLGYMGPRTKVTTADMRTIVARSISDRELEQAFEKIEAGQILLVIDACQSGQALEAEEWRRAPMNSRGLAQLAYEKGMYVLTAAQSFQAAEEVSQLGHGLLTYALVEEGIKRFMADAAPEDGQINVREWMDYATERVPGMQVEEMMAAGGQGRDLSFMEEERGFPLELRSGQQPRAFYRREAAPQPLIIAKRAAATFWRPVRRDQYALPARPRLAVCTRRGWVSKMAGVENASSAYCLNAGGTVRTVSVGQQ
jgi:WD40 repeat protein